jgi:hypothetical protein
MEFFAAGVEELLKLLFLLKKRATFENPKCRPNILNHPSNPLSVTEIKLNGIFILSLKTNRGIIIPISSP